MSSLVAQKVKSYPALANQKMQDVRDLIYQIADEDTLGEIEETLKWGEPSYLVAGGSTIRVDWKEKHPNSLMIYFNCKTILVETFKELYPDLFLYEGNRAIILELADTIPFNELKHCLSLALKYHSLKHLPLLGG